MSLTAGTRLGPYEIVGAIGAGGMGEVYRAHDARLARDVALKVLPASVADDPERLARFRREAQVLASLNHPNIATVHGFEEAGGVRMLVMELVEGRTLAELLPPTVPGPMSLGDGLPIARQIAEALEFAHEQGIVHRDLKPANVKVRDDGTVKVLDFGLAKALDANASGATADAMNSPTLTAHATQLGVILGTAAYMSPEQAKGKSVDRRADIWAFGVVLYEMLSGRRGYHADDVSDTLAAVLTREVDWALLPVDTPPRLVQLLHDCLVRDPKQRLRDIGDARRVIEKVISGAPDSTVVGMPAPSGLSEPSGAARSVAPLWRRGLPWAIAALAVLTAAAASVWALRAPAPAAAGVVTRSRLTLKDLSGFVALSRDGSLLAYSQAGGSMGFVLALRRTDQFEGKELPGVDGAYFPVFSPAGDWIAYGTAPTGGGKIKKVLVTGGASMALADGSFYAGADWGDDDTIVFSGPKGLMRMPANGGTPETLTTIDSGKGETAHQRPQFLPGGRKLLFTVLRASEAPQFAVLDLAARTYRTVAPGGDNGRYVPSGHLTYGRDGTLFAVPFDVQTLTLTGSPGPVVELVSRSGPPGTADYAFSNNGLLVYSEGLGSDGTTLSWVDRKGSIEAIPGQVPRQWGTGRLSPDGHRVANGIHTDKGTDIWIMGLDRGTANRVTFRGDNDRPVWTPDGRAVIYGGTVDEKPGLYSVAADGSSAPVLLRATEKPALAMSVSPDGRTLLYRQVDASGKPKIFVLTIGGAEPAPAPRLLREGDAADTDAQFSPDGRWVALGSAESGSPEIYLLPFPGPGGRVPVSREGGRDPRWSADGRELFFWPGTPGNTGLWGVSVRTSPAVDVGIPVQLFKTAYGTTWGPTPDGRFLIEALGGGGVTGSTFATVTNWFDELKRRVPAKK